MAEEKKRPEFYTVGGLIQRIKYLVVIETNLATVTEAARYYYLVRKTWKYCPYVICFDSDNLKVFQNLGIPAKNILLCEDSYCIDNIEIILHYKNPFKVIKPNEDKLDKLIDFLIPKKLKQKRIETQRKALCKIALELLDENLIGIGDEINGIGFNNGYDIDAFYMTNGRKSPLNSIQKCHGHKARWDE